LKRSPEKALVSETQRRAQIIAENKLALNAGWDEEPLAAELRDREQKGVRSRFSPMANYGRQHGLGSSVEA
jgi:hypothetical protein